MRCVCCRHALDNRTCWIYPDLIISEETDWTGYCLFQGREVSWEEKTRHFERLGWRQLDLARRVSAPERRMR